MRINCRPIIFRIFFFTALCLITGSFNKTSGQICVNGTPIFGAQVFIEPGQTPEEIDTWFRILKENQMPLCRIRMFESYMKKEDGSWDFTLFDNAFKAADKYGVKVFATLFPYTEKTDIGGFKFPRDDQHLESIANYIQHLVHHFRQFKSLYGWVLINEPGSGSIPDNSFARQKYQEWLQKNPPKEFTDKGFPILMNLTNDRFLMDYNTWYLNWIANEIGKYDTDHQLHVNNHAIFDNAAEYNFPAWRQFLTSLGGSAHPSWHFGYFDRNQYAVAMSANSEIIRSGAGELPWIMTEIQGGNNTYSGNSPFCPTSEEIAQWMWITIGTGSKGAVFWSLNPRASGIEAGEWAMLNFQNQPSDRLIAAKKVAETINNHAELFSRAKEVDSGINLLYTRESMWAEKAMAKPSKQNYEGRNRGAVIKSVMGYFEAISELGINCNLKEFREFDFGKSDYTGQVIILADQISVPTFYVSELENFVSKGGTLIVDGLTAFFDENLHNTMQTGFPFQHLFGGNISEFKVVDNLFDTLLDGVQIPSHLWRGSIAKDSGEEISGENGEIYALRHNYGNGEVIWVPSLLGLGSRIANNYAPLCHWLSDEFHLTDQPACFNEAVPGMMMKTLRSGEDLITILINKSGKSKEVPIVIKDKNLKPIVIFSNYESAKITHDKATIRSEETIVILWNN